MTQRIEADMDARVLELFTDNTTGRISEADLRAVFGDMVDSCFRGNCILLNNGSGRIVQNSDGYVLWTEESIKYLVQDNFNDDDGTTLPNHTADVDFFGIGYLTEPSGSHSIVINSNVGQVQGNSAGFGGNLFACADTTVSPITPTAENVSVRLTGTLYTTVYFDRQGVVIRKWENYNASGSGYWIGYDSTGPTVSIRAHSPNGSVLASTSYTWASEDPFDIQITCTGDTIDVDFDNGSATLSYSSATDRGPYFGPVVRGVPLTPDDYCSYFEVIEL